MANETVLRAHGLRTNVGKLLRVDTLDNKPHIVAPVVLITEGVHNNVLYSAAELAKHTDAWNGRPLVAPTHPTVNGKPVTANSKRVLEKMKVGTLLNVHWNASTKKLMGEAWFDKAATEAKCPKILTELEVDAPKIEVSTGLFTDDVMKVNTFGGKQYACEAKNHRPDHLAILTNEKGACSWEDGAGLPRINSAMDDDELDDLHVNFDPDQPRDENGRFTVGSRASFGGRSGTVGGHFTVGAGLKRVMMNFDDGETKGVPLAGMQPEIKPLSIKEQLNARQQNELQRMRQFVVKENSFESLNKRQREELVSQHVYASGDDDVDAEYLALFNAKFYNGVKSNSGVNGKTPGSILNGLLASEFRAWFTYIMGAELVMGKGRTNVAAEYAAHAEEELEHAHALIQRLQEKELPVTASLQQIASMSGADEAVPITVAETLALNNRLEREADAAYQEAIDYFTEQGDDTTVLLLTENQSVEQGHIHDLEQLASDAEVELEDESEDEDEVCPECGHTLVDGECPECDEDDEAEPKLNWDESKHPRDENGRFAADVTGGEHVATQVVRQKTSGRGNYAARSFNSVFHTIAHKDPYKAALAFIEAATGPAAQGIDSVSNPRPSRRGRDWRVDAQQAGDVHHYTFQKRGSGAKQNSLMKTLTAIAYKLGFNLNKRTDISINEKQNRVSKALADRYAPKKTNWASGNMAQPCMPSPWVRDLFDDYVIYEFGGKYFKLNLDWEDGQPVFTGDAIEVVQNTEWLPKNNSADKWVETEQVWGDEEPKLNWDASQPRDADGRWSDGGGGGYTGGDTRKWGERPSYAKKDEDYITRTMARGHIKETYKEPPKRTARDITSWNQRGQDALVAERKAAFDKDTGSIKLRDMERREEIRQHDILNKATRALIAKTPTHYPAAKSHYQKAFDLATHAEMLHDESKDPEIKQQAKLFMVRAERVMRDLQREWGAGIKG